VPNPPDLCLYVLTHVQRDQAWELCPYGCVGTFGFTYPAIQIHREYATVLQTVNSGGKFLDLGCGFGQNIRQMILDGAPAENLAGGDISTELTECGYDYFLDRDRLASKMHIFDILEPTPGDVFHQLHGSVDVVNAAMFFHLWDRPTQIRACVNTISLLKPQPGSKIIGWQIGRSPGGEVLRPVATAGNKCKWTFQHDPETWEKLWKEIGELTGSEWKVEAEGDRPQWMAAMKKKYDWAQRESDESHLRLTFTVTRL
jgi:SAM-dependent methyltransferase